MQKETKYIWDLLQCVCHHTDRVIEYDYQPITIVQSIHKNNVENDLKWVVSKKKKEKKKMTRKAPNEQEYWEWHIWKNSLFHMVCRQPQFACVNTEALWGSVLSEQAAAQIQTQNGSCSATWQKNKPTLIIEVTWANLHASVQ